MWKIIDKRLEEILLVTGLSVMVFLIFYQVVSRYFLSDSLSWTEELARYIHIWLVWLGASFAVRENKHIKVEMFKDMLPKNLKRWTELFSLLLWFALAVILAFISIEMVAEMVGRGQLSPAMRIPMWIAYSAVPVGTTLMTFRLTQQLILFLKTKPENSTSGGSKL